MIGHTNKQKDKHKLLLYVKLKIKKIINSPLSFFFFSILLFLVKTELSSCIIFNGQLLTFYEIIYV